LAKPIDIVLWRRDYAFQTPPQCLLASSPGASSGYRGRSVLWGANRHFSGHWQSFHPLTPNDGLALYCPLTHDRSWQPHLSTGENPGTPCRHITRHLMGPGLCRHPADASGVSNLGVRVLLQYLPDREAGRAQSSHPVYSVQPFSLAVQQYRPGRRTLFTSCPSRSSRSWSPSVWRWGWRSLASRTNKPSSRLLTPSTGLWDGSPSLWPN